jgi:hypothetical protein
MRTTTKLACSALLTGALAACSAPEVRNSYEGPERTPSDVAVLFTPKHDAYPDRRARAHFSAVDGKHYGTYVAGYPAATKVVPGEVLIKVNCFDAPPAKWESFLLFRATLEAGHYYELACDHFTASAIDRGTSFESIRHLVPAAIQDKLAP